MTPDTNPYESPTGWDEKPTVTLPVDDLGNPLSVRDLKSVRHGVAATMLGVFCTVGFATTVIGVSITVGQYSFAEILAFPQVPRWLVYFFVIIGGTTVPFGVLLSNQVRGRHRSLGWLGTLLYFVGGTGTVGILLRILSSGRLIGLAPLFGASVFSTFLTALALYAMFFRHWSHRCHSVTAKRGFEVSVMLLAIAGVSSTVSVLDPPLLQTLLPGQSLGIGGLFVVPACWVLFFALFQLRKDWIRASALPESAS